MTVRLFYLNLTLPLTLQFTASVSTTSGSGGSGSRGRRRTPTKPKTGPYVLKGKLYFHEKEEVPVLALPDGFKLDGVPKFFVNNSTGLKTLYFTSHDEAIEGVGIGILRSTGAGRVFVDTSAVDDKSEIFFGFKLSLEDVYVMLEAEPTTAPTPEQDAITADMATLAVKEEN